MKSEIFNGLVFAKFGATYDRDIAVATLRSAKFTHDDNRIWATQDLPIPARAKKNYFCWDCVGSLANGGLKKEKWKPTTITPSC